MRRGSKRCCWVFSCLLVFILLSQPSLPRASAYGGAPNLAYVAGTLSGVSVIDVGQAKVTRTLAVGGDPRMILLSPDGRFLYATQPALGRVAIIAAKTGQAICSVNLPGHPSVLALSLDASILYVAGDEGANVSALDASTCRVRQTYKTNGPVYGLAETALGTGNQLWVTGPTSLSVFDVRGSLLDDIPIAGGPQFLSIPNGFTAYVTTHRGTVLAVDMSSRRVSSPLLSGGTFGPMDYDALTGEVYVPDEKHNVLDVLTPIDPGTITLPKEPNRVIRTDGPPEAVAITSDGLLGFVALQGGRVAMLDLLGRHIVYKVSVGGTPRFIITGLYPPAIASTAPRGSSQQRSSPAVAVEIAFFALAMMLVALALFWLLWVRKYRGFTNRDKKGF